MIWLAIAVYFYGNRWHSPNIPCSIQAGQNRSFTGKGFENIVDGSLGEVQFTQPRGLYIFRDFLFVADSEVSAIRRIDLKVSN